MQKRFHIGLWLVILALLAVLPVSAQDTTTCAEGQRLIVHAAGEICVAETVERVVALEWTHAEDLLALGIQPVGVADIEGYKSWLKIPLTLADTVTDVGTRQEPNLEVITSLEPDLILAVSFRTGQNYEALSAIAPTLVFDPYPVDGTHFDEMVTTFNTIAQATNREPEGAAVLEAMNASFAEAHAALEAAGRAGETFILSQTFLSSEVPTFRLFTQNALAVQVLERIGLVNAWDDAPQQYGFSTVDFEGMAGIEDTNFLYVAQDDYNQSLTELPLWQGLPFVAAGHAYWLGGDAWLFGGPLSMEVVVDTVLATMGVEISQSEETASVFPVTIEHKYGSVTIESEPQKVVSLGYTDQDALIALGIEPIAIRYWYGDTADAIFPWADDEAGDAAPVVLNMAYGALNYEEILALAPDLIIAVDAGLTPEEYELLSQIAPTLAQSGDYIDFGMPWQAKTRYIGAAVGKAAEADALVVAVEAKFEAVRQQYPDFAGKTIAVAYQYSGNYGYYTDQDGRARFFADLGFVVPQELVELAGEQFYANVSIERIDLLNQDLLIFLGLKFSDSGREGIESDPLISSLPAVQEGRVTFIPEAFDDALQFGTVLSLEYALEGIVPELATALGVSQ